MKKALHLLNSIKHGGAENVAYNYAKILNELGVNSVFVGSPKSAEYLNMLVDNGVSVEYKLTLKLLFDVDYLFIHSNQNLMKLLPYFLLLKIRKIKVIYIQHLFYTHFKFKLLSVFVNFLCTDFIQITPITKDFLKQSIRIKKHFIVNFYIPCYEKKDWNNIRAKVRKQLDIPDASRVILFSAVFKPGKNVREFVNLADKLQEDKNTVFLLIGDGPESDVVQKYQGANLKWIGFVNDVEKYLIAADIYAFLSRFRFEMMPMALIEAVNTDKEIIAYQTSINDFLLDGNTFKVIDVDTLQHNKLPCGMQFKKFDKGYALIELRQLLCL